MKKLLLCSIILLFTYTAKSDVGFGLMVGEPTAITIKARSGGSNDWIFNIGSFSRYGNLRLDGIYTFNFPSAFNSRDFELYAGVGGVLAFGEGNSFFYEKKKRENDFGLGVKGLMGVNFKPSKKFEVFLELGPLIGLTNGVAADMELGLGFRFYP
ncbi:MAG: DUF3996 domain-containing protein [Candidatus Kapaibacterium sp.]